MLPVRCRVVVARHWLVPMHRQTAIDGLVLRMWREHPVVSSVRVRLVVVDLDLLRRHALYALHCEGCVLWSRTMVYNGDCLLNARRSPMIQ